MTKTSVGGKKTTGLGRGLSALLGDDVRIQPNGEGQTPDQDAVREVPVELLVPNASQPRRHFDEEALAELADSIRTQGVLQPILVRPLPSDPGLFEIVAGERRWRAAQRARLHQVPVSIHELNDAQTLTIALIENIQRADLSPMEEARAYRQLADDLGHNQENLAQAVGKSRSHVANLLRLLSLPLSVQKMVDEGLLSMGHARALINAEDPERVAKHVIEQELSVRQTEKLAQQKRAENARAGGRKSQVKDADTRALESDIAAALGLKVDIQYKDKNGGSIRVFYQTLEQLDDVCQRLCKD
ncbi:MAG: ParB/RepB/Spo0J family partition protein [Sphingomonadales bacterium]|jgi:ParB family chromosome partitioning protein